MNKSKGYIKDVILSISIIVTILFLFIVLSKLNILSETQIKYLIPSAVTMTAIIYIKIKNISLKDIGLTLTGFKSSFFYASISITILILFNTLIYEPRPRLNTDPISLIIGAIYFFLLVAPGEEIWCRGIIFTYFERLKGGYFALFSSAIIFGLFHIRSGVHTIIFATVFGFMFGLVRLKTRNILGLILLHGIFGFINVYLLI